MEDGIAMRTELTARDLLDEIGGLPFVDSAFRPPTLLALAAARRRAAEPEAFSRLVDYLDPANAAGIFARNARSTLEDFAWTPLPEDRVSVVFEATAAITTFLPEWKPLFDIPVRYRKVEGDYASGSYALIPQTIYLGEAAFSSPRSLKEALIHEHAHVWLTFIAEISDLQRDGAPSRFVLPSGTSGRSLRAVLLAGHFAAAVARFYLDSGAEDPVSLSRAAYMMEYLDGCVRTAMGDPFLTPLGEAVRGRLASFSASLRTARRAR
ncbi:HEXXH motif-containing putative peptide modification protein [Actinoallomurus purpureus]|uniref:aKG-HExxH-type peptide beta-hydroxylase n=1 Tax=Actinoallomurus purpureus TaxID=478114 RepID=UPI002093B791|nr:HEXXH motif-containing putative peptide modification protein [Actinoallomurus purpureus]MCO6003537.1 HEXXH motif-containing putative peptide modification protein [Actinoallomurus purpureus]